MSLEPPSPSLTTPRLERSPHPYRRTSLVSSNDGIATPISNLSQATLDGSRFHTPSEEGTEDDTYRFVKALPPAISKPHKGLRSNGNLRLQEDNSPLLTPSLLNEEGQRLQREYFARGKQTTQDEIRARQKFTRRWRAEVVRRMCECLSLLVVGSVVVCNEDVLAVVGTLRTEMTWAAGVLVSTLVLFPVRLLWPKRDAQGRLSFECPRIPASFDPAPTLYPPLLPVLVALSLAPSWPEACLPTVILGLSSIPSTLFPGFGGQEYYNPLHWIATLLPLTLSRKDRDGVFLLKGSHEHVELLSTLYPLHQCLLPLLHYLTTTSLLVSELQLLASSLTCLLLLSTAPQTVILSTLLWVGGCGLFLLCGRVIAWNVTLERLPERIIERNTRAWGGNEQASSQGDTNSLHTDLNSKDRRFSDSRSRNTATFLSMTPIQITIRKYGYAAYVYGMIIILVVGPIRSLVSWLALDSWEPFCWAIGYLFGDLPIIRDSIKDLDLQEWIPLQSPSDNLPQTLHSGWVDRLRLTTGQANVRLGLFIYWAGVIVMGLSVVLFLLPTFAEVDTRRKVFHGMMVVMLLPTTFIDPCFLSLGLGLVLVVFLLLDLIRASQLRPLSKPLARFLTPYVDGRDLRGPVVVSHIFLLIGCAIPFWLSLAAHGRTRGRHAGNPWQGWELDSAQGHFRHVSMVAGVVCVGMGDAAASLIGRRHGRHKWPWAGGKSLEGSAAFAVAVTAGLTLGKAWLRIGGWEDVTVTVSVERTWLFGRIVKAALAGCGASFTEAVLTGANDNVVVPVILWLLVRGLDV